MGSATPKNRGRSKKTQGWTGLKSGDGNLAVGSYLQRDSGYGPLITSYSFSFSRQRRRRTSCGTWAPGGGTSSGSVPSVSTEVEASLSRPMPSRSPEVRTAQSPMLLSYIIETMLGCSTNRDFNPLHVTLLDVCLLIRYSGINY